MAKEFDIYQKEAINIIQNSVVSAGAGSGKTTVLSERFLNLIENCGCNVDEILTLTFTKKATVEMSSRIYKVLKERSPKQAGNFYKSSIKTIDSYCAGIAKLGANHYGISPDFVQDQDQIKNFVNQLALSTILENRDRLSIKSLLKSADCEQLAQDLFVIPTLKNSTVITDFDFEKMIESQISEIIEFWDNSVQKIDENYRTILDEVEDFKLSGKTVKALEKIEKILAETEETIPPAMTKEKIVSKKYNEFYKYLKFVEKLNCLTIDKVGKVLDEVYKPAVKEIRKIFKSLCQIYDYIKNFDVLTDYYELEKEFKQKVDFFKRSSGFLTFADIAQIALQTLIDFPELRQIEKEKFKFIMIDEFQDNNESQKNLLFLLAEKLDRKEKSIPTAAELCPEKLFFVGDEKQSIYKFRGADVSVFRNLSAEFPKGNLNMSTNYRSHPALISMFNTFFGGISYPSFGNTNSDSVSIFYKDSENPENVPDFEAVYHQVNIPDSKLEGITKENFNQTFRPKTHFALYKEDSKLDTGKFLSRKENEAEWIACKIEEILSKNKEEYQKNPDKVKLLTESDFAILLRDTKNQSYFEKALLRHGIPYATSATTGVFSDGIVNDIFSLLRIIIYKNDSISYAKFLTSPFVNLSIKEMNKVILESKIPFEADAEFLSEESRNRYQKAKIFYTEISEFSKGNEISKIISKIWYDSGYYFETLWNENVSMYSIHYDLIFALALKAQEKQQSLASFVDEMQVYSADDSMKIEDLEIPTEESKGVQIMTVHKSKGLEFEVVFVADTTKQSGSDKIPVVFYDKKFGFSIKSDSSDFDIKDSKDSKTSNYFYSTGKKLDNQMAFAELKRIVYVALTRAKNELYISNFNYSKPKTEKTNEDSFPKTYFKTLEKVFDLYKENEEEIKPFDWIEVEAKERNFNNESEKRKNNFESKQELFAEIDSENLYQNTKTYQTEKISSPYLLPSALHSEDDETLINGYFENYSDAPFQEINKIIEESVPEPENPDEVESLKPAFGFNNFGTIAHAYMESAISGEKVESLYSVKEFIGLENDLTKIETVKNVCQKIKENFENSELGIQAKNSKMHKSELSFRNRFENKIIKGSIDLVFENQDGIFTVVDYKTNQKIQPELYYSQLKCYKTAVSQIFNVNPEKIKCILYYLRFGKAVEITDELK